MIELFKKNDITNALLLIPYLLVLRLYSLVHPTAYEIGDHDSFLTKLVFESLIPSAMIQAIVALILVIVQANLVNFLVNRSRILSSQSALPGMFYALFTSVFIGFQQLTPALIGMIFLILAAISVFRVYKKNTATENIFNAAVYISVASFFYAPFAIAAVALFIEITILKSFKLKERLQFLCGLLILYWISGSAMFYLYCSFQFGFGNLQLAGSLNSLLSFNTFSIIALSAVGFFILIGVLNYYNYMKKKSIGVRKKIDFFYWLLASSALCVFLFAGLDVQLFLFVILPISVFMAMSFLQIRNASLAELLHVFLVLGIVYLHHGEALQL